jgi:hypothetical protein
MITQILHNAVNAKVQLQDEFTAQQLELIKLDSTPETGGHDTLYASEYRGVIYIENLIGVVLKTISPMMEV